LALASQLAGCSTHILEDVGEVSIAHDCREPAKLFDTFTMRAKDISWSEPKGTKGKTSLVTLQLTFENVTKATVPLSNSGNGILYSVEFSLSGENASKYAPESVEGVVEKIHRDIKPGETAEGTVTFKAPKGNYLLSIERKFAGKPVLSKREEYFLACKMSAQGFSVARPPGLGGVSGVY
jgi:hypothetical protein